MEKVIFIKHTYILYVLFGLLYSNCTSQSIKFNETKFKNIPNTITKYKPEETIKYYMNIARTGEAMEIYINDMPFQKYYNGENASNYYTINDYILKSGTQKVRLKYISESGKPFRVDFSSTIAMKKVAQNQDFSSTKDYDVYKTPTKANTESPQLKDFVGAGSFVYEDSFTFEATVPYEFVGWAESEDLTKLKPEQLEKQAVAAYQNIIDICKHKDREALYKLFYQTEYEKAQSKYFDQELFEKHTEGHEFALSNPTVKFYPLENYAVHIYGNGKVVALESIENLGESALQFEAMFTNKRTGKKFEGISNLKVLLHKPKGSDKLVPIR